MDVDAGGRQRVEALLVPVAVPPSVGALGPGRGTAARAVGGHFEEEERGRVVVVVVAAGGPFG